MFFKTMLEKSVENERLRRMNETIHDKNMQTIHEYSCAMSPLKIV